MGSRKLFKTRSAQTITTLVSWTAQVSSGIILRQFRGACGKTCVPERARTVQTAVGRMRGVHGKVW